MARVFALKSDFLRPTPAQSSQCICVFGEQGRALWMLYWTHALQTLINILLCGSAEARSWALANLRCSRPILHNAARAQMPLELTFGRLTFNLQSKRAGLVVTFIKVQLLGSLQCDRLELHLVLVWSTLIWKWCGGIEWWEVTGKF